MCWKLDSRDRSTSLGHGCPGWIERLGGPSGRSSAAPTLRSRIRPRRAPAAQGTGGPARPGRGRGRRAPPPGTARRREEGGKGEHVRKGKEVGERRRSGRRGTGRPQPGLPAACCASTERERERERNRWPIFLCSFNGANDSCSFLAMQGRRWIIGWTCLMEAMLVAAAMIWNLMRLSMLAHKRNKFSERLQLLKLALLWKGTGRDKKIVLRRAICWWQHGSYLK